MSNNSLKPLLLTTGVILLGGTALWQSGFSVKQLNSGYQVASTDDAKAAEGKCGEGKCGEGKCGANKTATEGTCGADHAKMMEGKCGADKAGMTADTGMMNMMTMIDTNKDGMISQEEHRAHAEAMFIAADTNKDGMISSDEMKAHHEGKCGEGKCSEGKCGAEMSPMPESK